MFSPENTSRAATTGSPAVRSQATFVPSFILFVVVGGALGLAAVMLNRRHHRARAVTIAAAAVFFAWIVVQVAIIGYVSWMQPATFAAGLVMLLLMSLLPSSSEKAERF